MSENSVYQQLKQQIILLEHPPGTMIREKELMKEFGVSRTPVREALLRLEVDGLVRIIPSIGTFVEDVSFQQLKEVFEVRSFLLKLAGRLAAERITSEELAMIRDRIEVMKASKDQKTLMRLDREIHSIINHACKNKILVKIIGSLHDQAIRIWTFSGLKRSDYWQEIVEEFEEIAIALGQNDGERTAFLLEKHTKQFMENISSQLTF
jgi:DNA-binding GntR family transcriptional regulator